MLKAGVGACFLPQACTYARTWVRNGDLYEPNKAWVSMGPYYEELGGELAKAHYEAITTMIQAGARPGVPWTRFWAGPT